MNFEQFALKLTNEIVMTAEHNLTKDANSKRDNCGGDGGMNTKQNKWLAFPDAILQCSIVIQARFPVFQSKTEWDNDFHINFVVVHSCIFY